MKEKYSPAFKVMWILLGLLMLLPGLTKLFGAFDSGVPGVAGLLGGIFLFSWAPSFWAWILVLSEVVFGVLILFRWKLKYTTIPPMIIMAVIVLFVSIKWSAITTTSWSNLIFHLLAFSGYWMLREKAK